MSEDDLGCLHKKSISSWLTFNKIFFDGDLMNHKIFSALNFDSIKWSERKNVLHVEFSLQRISFSPKISWTLVLSRSRNDNKLITNWSRKSFLTLDRFNADEFLSRILYKRLWIFSIIRNGKRAKMFPIRWKLIKHHGNAFLRSFCAEPSSASRLKTFSFRLPPKIK